MSGRDGEDRQSGRQPGRRSGAESEAERRERQAAALRENLRRRNAQRRQRESDHGPKGSDEDS